MIQQCGPVGAATRIQITKHCTAGTPILHYNGTPVLDIESVCYTSLCNALHLSGSELSEGKLDAASYGRALASCLISLNLEDSSACGLPEHRNLFVLHLETPSVLNF